MILNQLEQLDPELTVFGDMFDEIEDYSTLPKLRAEFAQNMEQMKRIQLIKLGSSYVKLDEAGKKLMESAEFGQQQTEHFTNAFIPSHIGADEIKPEWWQIKGITPD